MQNLSNQNKEKAYGYFISIIVITTVVVFVVEFFAFIFTAALGMNAGTGSNPSWGIIPILILFIFPFLAFVLSATIFWRHTKGSQIKSRTLLSIIIAIVPVLIVSFLGALAFYLSNNYSKKQEKTITDLYSSYKNKAVDFQSWKGSLNNVLVENGVSGESETVASFELYLPPFPIDGEYHLKLDFIDTSGQSHQLANVEDIRILQQNFQVSMGTYMGRMGQVDSNRWQVNKEPLSTGFAVKELKNYTVREVKVTLSPKWNVNDTPLYEGSELILFEKSFSAKTKR